jgi:hypothetical protein
MRWRSLDPGQVHSKPYKHPSLNWHGMKDAPNDLFSLSSLFTPSQPPPYYDRISIIIWHCGTEVHGIKNYNHVLSRTNTPSWSDVSNKSNMSFLSVHLQIWKPVACLKPVKFLGSCGCVAVASFLGVPSSIISIIIIGPWLLLQFLDLIYNR